MSVQIASKGSEPCKVTKIDVLSNSTGKSVSLLGGFSELVYRESVMSDTITASFIFIDSGASIDGKSVREGLPLVGEEKVTIEFEDNAENKISVTLYVNSITPIANQTQKSILGIDLVSKEYLMNEKTRVSKRYDGKPSDHIQSVLTEVLESEKTLDAEATSNNLNIIGNMTKPFYFINNLCKKSVSAENQTIGKTAGYFFYETSEGFFLKSIDGLLDQEPKAKTIYNETPDTAGGNMPEGKDLHNRSA